MLVTSVTRVLYDGCVRKKRRKQYVVAATLLDICAALSSNWAKETQARTQSEVASVAR